MHSTIMVWKRGIELEDRPIITKDFKEEECQTQRAGHYKRLIQMSQYSHLSLTKDKQGDVVERRIQSVVRIQAR